MIQDDSLVRGAVESNLDRREFPRKRLVRELGVFTDDNFYSGFSEDISEGGIFVCTHELLPVGTHVQLSLELPGGHKLEAGGRVCWLRDPHDPVAVAPGMGVQFDALGAADAEAVREFMQNREPIFHQP